MRAIKSVFLLQHSYEIDNYEETKIIGIYTSKNKAELVIQKFQTLPGFKEFPECFYIDEYKLDEDNWLEGFIKIDNNNSDIS